MRSQARSGPAWAASARPRASTRRSPRRWWLRRDRWHETPVQGAVPPLPRPVGGRLTPRHPRCRPVGDRITPRHPRCRP
eukprot:1177055-Heterocapsa_arctica.AAC.1